VRRVLLLLVEVVALIDVRELPDVLLTAVIGALRSIVSS
jgi:hypothetical protein